MKFPLSDSLNPVLVPVDQVVFGLFDLLPKENIFMFPSQGFCQDSILICLTFFTLQLIFLNIINKMSMINSV